MRVWIGGTFDLFHRGHVRFLAAAARYGDVVVALNTDAFAERYKRKPVMTLAERFTVVGACRYVKWTCVNEAEEDSRPSILHWMPHYIAHGDDWTGEALMSQLGIDQDFLNEHNIRMLYLRYTAGLSTSDIIERIKADVLNPPPGLTC